MYRNLLVPLDGSPFGEHALPFAWSIAQQSGAVLHLAHVHTLTDPIYVEGMPVIDVDWHTLGREHERAYLAHVRERLLFGTQRPIVCANPDNDGSIAGTLAQYVGGKSDRPGGDDDAWAWRAGAGLAGQRRRRAGALQPCSAAAAAAWARPARDRRAFALSACADPARWVGAVGTDSRASPGAGRPGAGRIHAAAAGRTVRPDQLCAARADKPARRAADPGAVDGSASVSQARCRAPVRRGADSSRTCATGGAARRRDPGRGRTDRRPT